ncbi:MULTISPECIES: helix-turn-helix domain-containing protein [unclassified Enterococcus]|uniref:DUF536 domain-containing protein n=1 Tax=unclassified Enterococcus TaxID=2608891 RepID=UPI0015573C02|nr:DUF536 domain-containing protein [Enterococcus sp. MMGLQ5-2]MBS7585031.1 DUF536 domain-containing protein [Enterococcus sp. MMGLQ5-1]NPD12887.1 DUF536 domain-containing protein [Enterococcus sp. MMGLQ5-1]NPD37601.1 DUF536 domain-containing protein [Enterococcus sp. MMGLQ5-2]
MNTPQTITELADIFGVTRQAMNNRVKKLEEQYFSKNELGKNVVTLEGIEKLAEIYKLDAKINLTKSDSNKKIDDEQINPLKLVIESKEAEINRLYAQLQAKDLQIEKKDQQLNEKDRQISVKDLQISEKDKQIDQQQQLTARAMQDSEVLSLELKEEQAKGFLARLFSKKKKNHEPSQPLE